MRSKNKNRALNSTHGKASTSQPISASLEELVSAAQASGGGPPIDALRAAIQSESYAPGEPITSAKLAQCWVQANWNLVCFVALCRLTLQPGQVKVHGSWRAVGLTQDERERYFSPFVAGLGLPPRSDITMATLSDEEILVFSQLLLTLTTLSVQRSIDDYIFRHYNKGLGYGWVKAWEMAQRDNSKAGQSALLAILHTAPQLGPSLQAVLDRSFASIGFDRKYRNAVGKRPSARAGQRRYQEALSFLCFNPHLVCSFFAGQYTAQGLMDTLILTV